MNDYDTRFQSSLTDTPPLPQDLYPRIRQGIRRKTATARSVIAIAASLLVSVATIGYHAVRTSGTAAVAPAAVSAVAADTLDADLKSIVSYINSSDIDEQLVTYASLDAGL